MNADMSQVIMSEREGGWIREVSVDGRPLDYVSDFMYVA